MSIGESGEPAPTPESVMDTMDRLDTEQATLFEALACYASRPSGEHMALVNKAGEAARKAFWGTIETIVEQDNVSLDMRVHSLATVYVQTKERRVEALSQLAAEGEYEDDESYDTVSENIWDLFEADLDASEIALELTNAYIISYVEDLDELMDSLRPTAKMKAIYLAQDIGDYALGVGKISAGVFIGTILASKALKRLSE